MILGCVVLLEGLARFNPRHCERSNYKDVVMVFKKMFKTPKKMFLFILFLLYL